MTAKLHLGVFAICCLGFTAVAQLDSSALRGKYGPPLHREVFHIPSGFDLIVDYGASNKVCKLKVPALMPSNGKVSNASEMKLRMYDFLAELVPTSLRGKELGHLIEAFGAISVSSVEYEHVTIRELRDENQPFGDNNTITITFKNGDCQSPASQ